MTVSAFVALAGAVIAAFAIRAKKRAPATTLEEAEAAVNPGGSAVTATEEQRSARGRRDGRSSRDGRVVSARDAGPAAPIGGQGRPRGGRPGRSRQARLRRRADGVEAEFARSAGRALGGCRREDAVAMLGLSAGQAGEVEVDAGLRGAPAAPAAEVYTGVLYDRLGLPSLPAGGAPAGADRERPLGRGAARRPDPLLPAGGEGEAAGDRRPRRLLARAAGGGAARPRGRAGRRHALRRLRGVLEAAGGDPARGARLQRGGGQAQAGLAHGEGGARRSRQGPARGEEAARGPRGRRGARRGGRLPRRAQPRPPRRDRRRG